MTIPALPDAPALGDSPEVFNTKAFAFVAALDDWGTAANAVGVAADADASAAAASASTATTQAGIATTKANEAAASALDANSAELAAQAAQTAAELAATNAAASYDSFDDRYLGAKSSDPSVDNDGGALIIGALYFNTTDQKMKVYASTGWKDAGSAVNGTARRQTFTATAGQTSFTVTDGYDANFADVYLNGVKLVNGTDVTVSSGTAVVLASGAAAGDVLDVVAYGAFEVANTYTQGEADALLAGKVATTGSETIAGVKTFTSEISAPNTFGFKNRIINGAMMIDQRNTGASVTIGAANTYTIDRWQIISSAASKVAVQQNAGSVTPPAGFTKYLGVTSQSAYSVGSGDYFGIVQPIEGYNIADFGFGASGAATITFSFWVRSSLTGTFGGSLYSNNASPYRSYPFTYTISAANTWEQKTITVVGDTGGVWNSTNGDGLQVRFGLGTGTTYSGGTLNTWQNGNYVQPTGSVSVVGTNGATFYITGVQLEKGSTATSFDYRPYGTELALCQRYYYRLKAGSSYANAGTGRAYSTTNGQAVVAMPVSMRTAPTGGYSALSDWNAAGSGSITAMSPAAQYSLDYRQMTIDITMTFGSGQAVILNANNTTNAWIDWSAEL
jgi:hypothetical protein